MFSKQQILDEIVRTAAINGGVPLGQKAMVKQTGIQQWDWRGRYWLNWSDALAEAGFDPNTWNPRVDDDVVLQALALEVRRLGDFPTRAQIMMGRRRDPTFPSEASIRRRGSKSELIRRVLEFCEGEPDHYADVLAVLRPLAVMQESSTEQAHDQTSDTLVVGHVYLLKLGKHYKVGRSNSFGRRERELAIQMPERTTTVHVINTDDPVGIEAYWHRRFADRRVRADAEWFELTQEDVRAFKRRGFQ